MSELRKFRASKEDVFLENYMTDICGEPSLYTGLSVHGVRCYLAGEADEVLGCVVDDVNPEFLSVYAKHADGTSLVVADASLDKASELRVLAEQFAAQYGWEYQDFTLKGYDVHIFAVVRVKVTGVKATGHAEAIKKAEASTDLTGLFGSVGDAVEFADDIDCFLVDEAGDGDFLKSRWYEKDGATPLASTTGNEGARLVVHLEGGLVQAVYSDSKVPIKVAIQDFDVDGADQDEMATLDDGTEFVGRIESILRDDLHVGRVFAAFGEDAVVTD